MAGSSPDPVTSDRSMHRSVELPVTFGTPVRRIELADFVITDATYARELVVAPHDHTHASWTAVVRGGFEEAFRGLAVKCEAGAIISKPPTATHANRYGLDGARALVIEIREPHRALGRAAPLLGQVSLIPPKVSAGILARLWSELCTQASGWELAVHALLLEIGLLLYRRDFRVRRSCREHWLSRVADRLEMEFRRSPSLELLAVEAGVHPVYLCHVFRRKYGCSPGEYARRARLDVARRMLVETDTPIAGIAFACGFSDQSHLTRSFRTRYGMAPGQYRTHQIHQSRA